MLDGSGIVPLYVQLMDTIEEKIATGEFKPGERLPSEMEMAKKYGVSIITVRNAVKGLVEKGLVDRKQGKGTFVAKPKYMRNMRKLQSFSDMCEQMGVVPGGQMLENRLVEANEKIASRLNINKGDQVVFISRIRYADNEPVAIENNYFPIKYSFLLGETFDNCSLFKFIAEHTDNVLTASEKRIELCRATAKEAQLLNMSRGDFLLCVKSTAFDKMNEPMYVGTQIINGERFSLYVYEGINA